MFFAGFNLDGKGWSQPRASKSVMLMGRFIMGLGVGAFDSVIPVFSAELMDTAARGKALAQQFQWNIFGLNMAFIINVLATRALGKWNQWAWRISIIAM
jgi:predicted MFS family arabinose efflux permease